MCGSRRSASSPRTRAASSSRSWRASSPAMSNTTSPPRWRSSSTASPTTRSTGATCCATSGATSSARSTSIKDLRVSEVLDVLDDDAGAASSSRRARTAPIRASARPAATAGSRSSSASSAPSSAARTIRNAATRASSPPTAANGADANKVLGKDPETGLDVTLRVRPVRPLCAARRRRQGREKPKRAGLPKGWSPDDIDLETALKLLSLPREVGKHPESGEPILAGIGRFGPYVQHGKTYANLDAGEDVLTIGLNRAVTLIAEKLANPGKGRRFGADPGRSLGDHPTARRADPGQEGPLRPLRHQQRRQRHAAGRQEPRRTITLDEGRRR